MDDYQARELAIMLAPNPPESWMNLQRNLDKARNPYNEGRKPKLRDDLEIIIDYKIAAYKLLQEKLNSC